MPDMKIERTWSVASIVAVIMAIGISLALNMMTFAAIYAAFHIPQGADPGLSENATQVLTGWGGGMIGVLGAYVGAVFGKKINDVANGHSVPAPPRPPGPPQPKPSGAPKLPEGWTASKPPAPAPRQAPPKSSDSYPVGGQQ